MKTLPLFSLAIGLVVAFTGCSSVEQAPQGETLLAEAVVLSAEGRVVGVNYQTRVVKLETPSQPRGWLEVVVGDDVKNLSQVRSGDRVTVKFIEAVSMTLFRPGEVEPGVDVDLVNVTAAPGERPAGASGIQQSFTAVIEAVDRGNELVRLKLPDGAEKVVKVRTPANLTGVSVGDKVRISFTRAVGVAVTPGSFG